MRGRVWRLLASPLGSAHKASHKTAEVLRCWISLIIVDSWFDVFSSADGVPFPQSLFIERVGYYSQLRRAPIARAQHALATLLLHSSPRPIPHLHAPHSSSTAGWLQQDDDAKTSCRHNHPPMRLRNPVVFVFWRNIVRQTLVSRYFKRHHRQGW